MEAHAIQVLDEPLQSFALQTRNGTSIPFTAKEIAEALVELRRSSVEAAELFEGIGWVHDGCLTSQGLCESAGGGEHRCLARQSTYLRINIVSAGSSHNGGVQNGQR